MNEEISMVFENHRLRESRLLSWSKSGYRQQHPDNDVYFNANIFTLEDGKVWYGDLDVTSDEPVLTAIAKEIGKDLYILREMDGRFDNEELTKEQITERAKRVIKYE